MKVHESFALQHIDDTLRSAYSFPEENQLQYKFDGHDEHVGVLEVKGEGVCQQYVIVKVSDNVKPVTKQSENLLLIQPSFVIQNKNQQCYGAFENLESLKVILPNQLTELKALLESLAAFQSTVLKSPESKTGEYALKDIIPPLSKSKFKDFDLSDAVQKLQSNFERSLNVKSLLVNSIWSTPNNSYVNQLTKKVVFLNVSNQEGILLPPLYDALLYIFALSDEKFRQKYFNLLVSHYFEHLEELVNGSGLPDKITRSYKEIQLDDLLPIVKVKIAVELGIDNSVNKPLQEIVSNLENYFSYPMLNQEEIYEVIQNKLSSDNYKLQGYRLVPLNEKNGHLGEYFHLIIQVLHENVIKQINLFAKILMAHNETFKEILEMGVGKKEDFFYNILCPMYRAHGLEELMDFAPRCYLSRLSKIVLDDLIHLGYKSNPLNSLLNVDCIQKLLSKLAKLHASSIIMEEILSKNTGKTVRFGDDYGEYLQETIFCQSGKMATMFDSSLISIKYCVEKNPHFLNGLKLTKEELNSKLKDVMYSVFSKIQRSGNIRNVINHGDLYTGNMLFKSGTDDDIEDGILVDFQILRYIPPAYEVMFFVTLSSSKETKEKYLDDLLYYYYDSLCGHLRRFDLDPEEIYSREHFQKDIKYAKSASMAISFNYAHMLFVKPELREEITHSTEKMKYYFEDNKLEFMDLVWQDENYREIVSSLVQGIIELIRAGEI